MCVEDGKKSYNVIYLFFVNNTIHIKNASNEGEILDFLKPKLGVNATNFFTNEQNQVQISFSDGSSITWKDGSLNTPTSCEQAWADYHRGDSLTTKAIVDLVPVCPL